MQQSDQRRETRVNANVRFFVHVHESKSDPDMVGMSLECEAVDMSAHGMQFSTNSALTESTLLNITIGIGEPFAMYLLRGEVRWVRHREDQCFIGVMLQEAEDTDLERWLDNFEAHFSG